MALTHAGYRPATGALLLSVILALSGAAASFGAEPSIVFNHLETNHDAMYELELRHGQEFTIQILKTLPDRFDFDITAVEPAPDLLAQGAAPTEASLGPKTLKRTHDKRYGGYFVHIVRKPGAETKVVRSGKEPVTLNSVTLLITVKTQQFHAEVSGGFTGSSLRDPVYALETRQVDGTDQQFVVQDAEAEDAASLGLASFVHVYHDKFPHAALTFGLGVTSTSRTSYYLGGTVRLGSAAAVTAGGVWGSVSRLPAGIGVGDAVPAGTTLTDLPTKVDRGFFVALSYTFIKGADDALQKPFGKVTD